MSNVPDRGGPDRGGPDRGGPNLERRRELAVVILCDHFADDVLDVDDFERRVDRAHRATSLQELRGLLEDLPGGDRSLVAASDEEPNRPARPGPTRVPTGRIREKDFVVGIVGGSVRRGRWIPARWTMAVGIMGGAVLDFREAALGPGVAEVTVLALMGGIQIIVPPGMDVEARGVGIMGGFDHTDQAFLAPDPDRPALRIRGIACMGGVEVAVRYPGESDRDARKRQRKEKKRLARGG